MSRSGTVVKNFSTLHAILELYISLWPLQFEMVNQRDGPIWESHKVVFTTQWVKLLDQVQEVSL